MPQDAFNDILYALSHRSRTLNYLEPQGSMELREALSVHLQTTGIQASPDSILIVSGSLQALHLISVGLLPRGSAVLLEKPSAYLYSIHAFQSAGLKMSGIPRMTKDYTLLVWRTRRSMSKIKITSRFSTRSRAFIIPPAL